jgi:hypothetical protein
MALLVRGGKLFGVSCDGTVDIQETQLDEQTKYQILTSVTYGCRGRVGPSSSLSNDNSDSSSFAFTIPLAKCRPFWNRTDILGELPLLIRKVIQAVMTKPFCYMWWERAVGQVKIGDVTEELDGYLYHETTLLKQ